MKTDMIGDVSFAWRDALYTPVLVVVIIPTAMVWGITSHMGPDYLWQAVLAGLLLGALAGFGIYRLMLGETVRKAAHWELGVKKFDLPLFSPEELAQLQSIRPEVLAEMTKTATGLNLRLRKLSEINGKGRTPHARAEWLRVHLKSREVREWKEQAEALKLWLEMMRRGNIPAHQTGRLRLVKR